jgi:hypothetical protein
MRHRLLYILLGKLVTLQNVNFAFRELRGNGVIGQNSKRSMLQVESCSRLQIVHMPYHREVMYILEPLLALKCHPSIDKF